MIRLVLIATAVLLAAAFDARAEQKIYKCKNENGELYYSQTYDPKRCGGGGAQMSHQGVAVKKIDRIKTPEELAAEKAQAQKDAEAKKIADKKAHEDQVLMQSYANEEELVRVHEDGMRVIDTAIATTRMSMKNQEKSLTELLAAAAEAERAKKPVPESISKGITTVRKTLEEQQAQIAKREAEKVAATAGFEAKRARFRELKAAQEKQLSGQ
ncbi:MAG TPA: DUF4124 domain-containing protein [Xanthomonadales bacterium]|nr:DUF4124 domain-containing protein [Xanthomonadales bacterium]